MGLHRGYVGIVEKKMETTTLLHYDRVKVGCESQILGSRAACNLLGLPDARVLLHLIRYGRDNGCQIF